MCVFTARNNNSNDQYLLVIAQLAGECETKQDKGSEPARSVQDVVNRKTQIYSNIRHYAKPVWTGFYVQGHLVSVRSRSGPSKQDSSDATSVAMLKISSGRRNFGKLRLVKF